MTTVDEVKARLAQIPETLAQNISGPLAAIEEAGVAAHEAIREVSSNSDKEPVIAALRMLDEMDHQSDHIREGIGAIREQLNAYASSL